ncbi:MAG: hypothetical protein ABIA74_01965, partial [bacterium]
MIKNFLKLFFLSFFLLGNSFCIPPKNKIGKSVGPWPASEEKNKDEENRLIMEKLKEILEKEEKS